MVPAPSCPFTWDYWTSSATELVELTCLMPNSVYIPLRVGWDATLLEVKEELWKRAAKYPLFAKLYQMSYYIFQFVNSLAVLEEVDDEHKRLRDIKPVCGVLVIIKRCKGTREERLLNTQISKLIGKGLNEFDSLFRHDFEGLDFRKEMRELAEENFKRRLKCSAEERLLYQYPPRLASQPGMPKTLESRTSFILTTYEDKNEIPHTDLVNADQKPSMLIRQFFKKKNKGDLSDEQLKRYVLKVYGREEYLLEDRQLIEYLYIQETLSRSEVPRVIVVNIDTLNLTKDRDVHYFYLTDSNSKMCSQENYVCTRNKPHELSWNIDKNFTCTVIGVTKLNVETATRLVEAICQVGIYHGGKPICEARNTGVATVSEKGEAQWDEKLEFPIKVQNVPRMARLCFVIYEINRIKGRKRKDCINKLAWVNTMVFDYRHELRNNTALLHMWTPVADETQGDDLLLHPLGTVVSNPNTDACAALLIRFSDYDCKLPILFPPLSVVKAYAEQIETNSPDQKKNLSRNLKELCDAARKDPLYEMHEQEKKDLWASREYFRKEAPDLLPKLISCIEWSDRAEAASVVKLIDNWQLKNVETALELLDYAYADALVRSFAVKRLNDMSNQDLLLYLLQLVQALKHEPYLMCDLTKFLLKRAFDNMTIGHYLFWHLRSEMQVPYVSVRFGLILEAYCRGCQDHINILMKQITCLEKLKWVTMTVKENKDITKARKVLSKQLQEPHCQEALRDFVSPLNPSFVCDSIIVENCNVMDSKKRPLLLEFKNMDPLGPNVKIILKIGDDLRQDMFTLQMLRIMDRLWQNAGYDFRLCPYNCISMDTSASVGMIEVVDKALTIATIQKNKAMFNATSTINKTLLFTWLKEYNKTDVALNKAVEEFTMSCAGYCVATYVLGIADRHPDNIMLRENGQLFHIDFGHFLGHFKHKFGFKRERVPFVLTHNFIHVINKGQKGSGDQLEFTVFRRYCEDAFKILRRHGHLILSLFSMMISTGLPELSSEKDLQYLRDTLVLDLPEEKAIEHFRSKFTEAYKKAWTTNWDWMFHNCDRNN